MNKFYIVFKLIYFNKFFNKKKFKFFFYAKCINMGGGLMQLVAYGAQDIYLTGNPQITFFKVVYRRHTNFSIEAIQQTFNGTDDFGGSVSATISRNGDLVHRMYLEHDVTITASAEDKFMTAWANYGNALIKECELEIGGQKIDKHIALWNQVYSDLTQFNPSGVIGGNSSKASDATDYAVSGESNGTLYNVMTGTGANMRVANAAFTGNANLSGAYNGWSITHTDDSGGGDDTATANGKWFIPLTFWFCRNPGLALPLIALQYHEVKVKMTFETLSNLVFEEGATTTVRSDQAFNLWADYIYLDTDERRRFAQVSHEYLIEQVQYFSKNVSATSGVVSSETIDLNFNHPVKELVWAFQGTAGRITHSKAGYLPGTSNGTIGLKLNGHDRFKERNELYFTRTQVWEHHTGNPVIDDACNHATIATTAKAVSSVSGDGVYVYSFALKPEEHQPSGTCNFSRIDNAQLILKDTKIDSSGSATSADMYIFAVNYNVLRIMSGMGGLAYSN